eukprot:NODE_954_length_2799_cov_0.717037.p1 type:complete len:298 gc:universal NODE_954_length_2799_cov_0.717037:888-1781(+)
MVRKKKSTKKPPDNIIPFYQCIKMSLKSIVKNDIIISKLTDVALEANSIVIYTLHLVKLYLIHCYDTNIKFPIIDRQFVTSVMKVLCDEPVSGRPPTIETKLIKDTLKVFYELHYKNTVNEKLSFCHMNTTLDYLSTDVITIYENNIKQNYVEYVERFVNVLWRKKELISVINIVHRNEIINKLCRQLRYIKNDLLRPEEEKTCNKIYHAWIDQQRINVTPSRQFIYYDIQCSPQDYLPLMMYMMKTIESYGTSVNNVCPLRSDIIPKNFRLDTVSLINVCFTKEQGKKEIILQKEI